MTSINSFKDISMIGYTQAGLDIIALTIHSYVEEGMSYYAAEGRVMITHDEIWHPEELAAIRAAYEDLTIPCPKYPPERKLDIVHAQRRAGVRSYDTREYMLDLLDDIARNGRDGSSWQLRTEYLISRDQERDAQLYADARFLRDYDVNSSNREEEFAAAEAREF